MIAPVPPVVNVAPAPAKSEPLSPFIASLKRMADEAEAARQQAKAADLQARQLSPQEQREYNDWLLSLHTDALEQSARAAEAADEVAEWEALHNHGWHPRHDADFDAPADPADYRDPAFA